MGDIADRSFDERTNFLYAGSVKPLVEVVKRLHFFHPTAEMRQLLLLGSLAGEGERISQRGLAERAALSPAVVNGYLNRFTQDGLVDAKPINDRDRSYLLTPSGHLQVAQMAVEYMRETFVLFSRAKAELRRHLAELQSTHGIKRVVLYPAGEVAELVIHALVGTPLEVLALVDDAPQKQGCMMFGFPVVSRESIEALSVDGVLVTTFRYRDAVMKKINYLRSKGIAIVGI